MITTECQHSNKGFHYDMTRPYIFYVVPQVVNTNISKMYMLMSKKHQNETDPKKIVQFSIKYVALYFAFKCQA